MAEKTRNPEDLVEVPAQALDKATTDLKGLFGAEDKADSKANKAGQEARKTRENSIRNTPEKLASALDGTNYSFDDLVVNPDADSKGLTKETVTIGELLAHRVAKAIAKGDTEASAYHSRKSELRLLIETRDHIHEVVSKLDAYSEHVAAQTGKTNPVNVRQQTLGALRKIRKDTSGKTTPDSIVEDLEAKRTYTPSPQEKATKALERLSGMSGVFSGALQEGGSVVMDDRAEEAFRVLQNVIDSGPDIHGTLQRAREESNAEIEAEIEATIPEEEESVPEEEGEEEEGVPDIDDLMGFE